MVVADILLSGLGIQSQHCRIEIITEDIFIHPYEGARTCINGREVKEKTKLKNGDRILWGSNHFFRLNCPNKSQDDGPTEAPFDWKMAQEEVVMSERESSKSMKDVIAKLEVQYEQEKKEALENQKKDFERQFQKMKLSIESPAVSLQTTGSEPALNPKLQTKSPVKFKRLQSEETSKQSYVELKENLIKANILVREGNLLCEELESKTRFSVTLQIPTQSLTPNKHKTVLAEPTIVCKHPKKPKRFLSLDMFENRVFIMREQFQTKSDNITNTDDDEEEALMMDHHELIGVANIFLEVLFYDVRLTYAAPIISKHGKIVGQLHFDIERTGGSFPQDRDADAYSDSCSDVPENNADPEESGRVQFRLRIHEASGISPVFCHDIYCNYSVCDQSEMTHVQSVYTGLALESVHKEQVTSSIIFNHSQEYSVEVSEDFMDQCLNGSVAVEVYGRRADHEADSKNFDNAIAVKWKELSKKLSLTVNVQELNDNGEYNNVKVVDDNDGCGGTFLLRQGQQRRIVASVKPISRSGGLPFLCESVVSFIKRDRQC